MNSLQQAQSKMDKMTTLTYINDPSNDIEVVRALEIYASKIIAENGNLLACKVNIVTNPYNGSKEESATDLQESGNVGEVEESGSMNIGEDSSAVMKAIEVHIVPKDQNSKLTGRAMMIPIMMIGKEIKTPLSFVLAGTEYLYSPENVKRAVMKMITYMSKPDTIPDDSPFSGVDEAYTNSSDFGALDGVLKIRDEMLIESGRKIASESALDELIKTAANLRPLSNSQIDKINEQIALVITKQAEADKNISIEKQAAIVNDIGMIALRTEKLVNGLNKCNWKQAKDVSNNAHVEIINRSDSNVWLENAKLFKESFKNFQCLDRVATSKHSDKPLITSGSEAGSIYLSTEIKATGDTLILSESNGYKIINGKQNYLVANTGETCTLKFKSLKDILKTPLKNRTFFLIRDNDVIGPFTIDDCHKTIHSWQSSKEGNKEFVAPYTLLDFRVVGADTNFSTLVIEGARPNFISLTEAHDHILSSCKNAGIPTELYPKKWDFEYHSIHSDQVFVVSPESLIFEATDYISTPLEKIEDIIFGDNDGSKVLTKEENLSTILKKAGTDDNLRVTKPDPTKPFYDINIVAMGNKKTYKNLSKELTIRLLVDIGVPSSDVGSIIGVLDTGEKLVSRNYPNLSLSAVDGSATEEKIQDKVKSFAGSLFKSNAANNVGTSIIANQLTDYLTSGAPGLTNVLDLVSKVASESRDSSRYFEKLAVENKSKDLQQIAKIATAGYYIDLLIKDCLKHNEAYEIEKLSACIEDARPELEESAALLVKLAHDQLTNNTAFVSNARIIEALSVIDRVSTFNINLK